MRLAPTVLISCFVALVTLTPTSTSAAIIIANSGFAGNFVTLYDQVADTSYTVWPGTNALGGITYDARQDHVYFTTAFSTTDRLLRDTAPTDPHSGLQTVRDFGGGASDVFAFRGIDMASGSRVAYAWANGNGSSAPHVRYARVEILNTVTGGISTLFSGSDLNTDLRDVAVDSSSNWVYVSDSYYKNKRIFRVNIENSSFETILTQREGLGALEIAGDNLYWAEWDNATDTGSIWRSDLLGNGATSLLTVDYRINDIAVGDDMIYWTNVEREAVKYRALSGGTIQELGGNAAHGNLVALADAPNAIPEPSSILSFAGLALCFGVGCWWWKRRRQLSTSQA